MLCRMGNHIPPQAHRTLLPKLIADMDSNQATHASGKHFEDSRHLTFTG